MKPRHLVRDSEQKACKVDSPVADDAARRQEYYQCRASTVANMHKSATCYCRMLFCSLSCLKLVDSCSGFLHRLVASCLSCHKHKLLNVLVSESTEQCRTSQTQSA